MCFRKPILTIIRRFQPNRKILQRRFAWNLRSAAMHFRLAVIDGSREEVSESTARNKISLYDINGRAKFRCILLMISIPKLNV